MEVTLEIIHSAVGTITESDVLLASASTGIILGFHTRVDSGVADKAKHEGVQIKLYAIIYELIDEVKEAMAGLLDPILKEVIIGSAEDAGRFSTCPKDAPVCGLYCCPAAAFVREQGALAPPQGSHLRGITQSLRRFQDEVNEVRGLAWNAVFASRALANFSWATSSNVIRSKRLHKSCEGSRLQNGNRNS